MKRFIHRPQEVAYSLHSEKPQLPSIRAFHRKDSQTHTEFWTSGNKKMATPPPPLPPNPNELITWQRYSLSDDPKAMI